MLISNEQLKLLPTIEAVHQFGIEIFNAMAWFKFLTLGDKWAWYALASDGEDLFWGFINGIVPELGYFHLSDLMRGWENARLPVIVDPHDRPEPLKRVLVEYVQLRVYPMW